MEIRYDKYFSYFLGYLWADGRIEKYRILLEILEDDAITIIDDIKKISFLDIKSSKRVRKNRKPQMTIYFCNVKIYQSFFEKYFVNKSSSSPTRLIEDIPIEYQRYFYLGLIDGDGCFYLSKDSKTRQFYITSSYDQDWTHIENLYKKLKIEKYEIRRTINSNGNKSSYIRIKKYDEILQLFRYLYPNGYEIGLSRKFKKCESIIKDKPKYIMNTKEINIHDLIDKIQLGIPISEISKIYDCSWKKIYNFCKKNDLKHNKGFFSGLSRKVDMEPKENRFMDYDQASTYIQGIGLKSQKDWNKFCSDGERPNNIPRNPNKVYKDKGWISWSSWLGY